MWTWTKRKSCGAVREAVRTQKMQKMLGWASRRLAAQEMELSWVTNSLQDMVRRSPRCPWEELEVEAGLHLPQPTAVQGLLLPAAEIIMPLRILALPRSMRNSWLR